MSSLAPSRRPALVAASVLALASVIVAACRIGGDAAHASPSASASSRADGALPHPPGYVVDSTLPPEEALRRFREGLPAVTRLEGGATSRARLVADFVRAVEHGDSAALRRMEITKGEFAYLVYPSSIYTRPPYQEQPEILWLLQRAKSGSGYRRLMQRIAGRPLGYRGYRCASAPEVRGENRVWGDCAITYRTAAGDSVTGRLFGAILEREGRFKFVSYANDL